jgi:hypothetical protein
VRLVEAGLLRRQPYRELGQRTRYEYRLTDAGRDLYPVLVALLQWGDRHLDRPDGPVMVLTHRECGEPVHMTMHCAAGHEVDSPRQVRPIPGPGAASLPA